MGKQRITRLLEELEANRIADLQNAAAIYTVAQVAVDQLEQQLTPSEEGTALPALPPAPSLLDKAELQRRYGSFNACRQAAKQQGIKFSKTPSWQQLAAAFAYTAALRDVVQSYLELHPHPGVRGMTIEFKL